jgi:hypothetical protein
MAFDFREELAKMTPKIAEGAKIYVFGAGSNWEYICKSYKYLVNIDIDDYIDGFIDNDRSKQGTLFHGKPVYDLSCIDSIHSVILISVSAWKANKEIVAQLLPFNIYQSHSVFDISWEFNMIMRYEYECFLRFKDMHKGERCFIVGNGPSLNAGDLDRMKNEASFGTNKIFLIFNETEWRPTYYVCEDEYIFKDSLNEIKANIQCPAFYSREMILSLDEFDLRNFLFFQLDARAQWKQNRVPRFSEELFLVSWGATVTYTCIQLAAYMGFGEIYLLGCDNTFVRGVKANGELVFGRDVSNGHFSKDYVKTNIYYNHIDVINAAYQTAREYCESHNIKIRNATRGGALEIFERVDFDSLF